MLPDCMLNFRDHRARRIVVPVLVLLPLTVWLCSAERMGVPGAQRDGGNVVDLNGGIDPNTAPWWELTALPQVGETIARRIVSHREAQAATSNHHPFRTADDLDNVHGIGPKTIARIRDHLTFPASIRSTEN